MASLPTVEQLPFKGWEGVRLSNGLIDAVCVPELGGRLMQFSLGPQDYLFINRELLGKRFTFEEHAGDGAILNWKNYGGDKTWPAPQGWDGDGQWPGPPDPVLDSGRYAFETRSADQRATVAMTSPPDARSGIRIHRQISLGQGSSRLQLDLSFENISQRTLRWSIWDVAQLACDSIDGGLNTDCWLYIPTDPAREPAYEIMFGEDNPQYQLDAQRGLLAVQYQGIVGKIGVHSPAGWIAFANRQSGFVLCMQFSYQPEEAYPDNGATVECWTESPGAPSPIPISSPGCILEAEILSPLYTLKPGETAAHRVIWSAAYCPAPVASVADAGCTHQPLQADINNGWARLQGRFGCFIAGRAALDYLDEAGDILHRTDLGLTTPFAALNIDAVMPVAKGTRRMRLAILDGDSVQAGVLDSIDINNRA